MLTCMQFPQKRKCGCCGSVSIPFQGASEMKPHDEHSALNDGRGANIPRLAWILARRERKGSLYVDIGRAGINMLVDT